MTRVFTYISSYTTCGDHVDALPEGDRPDEGNVCNTADSVVTSGRQGRRARLLCGGAELKLKQKRKTDPKSKSPQRSCTKSTSARCSMLSIRAHMLASTMALQGMRGRAWRLVDRSSGCSGAVVGAGVSPRAIRQESSTDNLDQLANCAGSRSSL